MIFELVGPAGAGKSTLTEALRRQGKNLHAESFPNIKEIRNLPFFLTNAFALLSTFLMVYRNRKLGFLSSEQMVLMMILNGWHRQLKNLAKDEIILLDQGPVYLLAELLRFGPDDFREAAAGWWERVCGEWAKTLEGIVCLDTSDSILMERIRAREKSHGVKDHSDQWATQFLAKYRQAQAEVLQCMAARTGSFRMLNINTSQASLNETVDTILAWINS